MQKLLGNITPTDVPQVCGSVAGSLNSSLGVVDSVTSVKTPDNILDAELTPQRTGETNLRVSSVYVLNLRGEPLMPTTPRNAKIWLRSGKAKVVQTTPFTIQLLDATGENKQPVKLGVDTGSTNVGLSARSEKKELHVAEVELRNDVTKLLSKKSQFRRTRRGRLWHRPPRFNNRKNRKGKLPPSLQSKEDATVKAIKNVCKILPVTDVTVEVANFDIQKIKNPDITNEDYQQGEMYGFSNVREYVFYRDHHTCQNCFGKSKDPRLEAHHLESRQTGSDRPENRLTLCITCHDGVTSGEIELDKKPPKSFRPESFMTTTRKRLVERLKEETNCNIEITYGYITKQRRQKNKLPKSHTNDAFVIAGGNGQLRSVDMYKIKQVRKCNRKLHKGSRSHIKNTAPRFINGFQRYDKVLYKNQKCFIFGRRTSGYFDLRKLDGTKVHSSAKSTNLKLLKSASTMLIEAHTSSPRINSGVSVGDGF